VICLVSVGFCFGTFLSVVPIIVGDFYGHVNFGLYFGYIQLGATGATFIIPNIAEVIKQQMVRACCVVRVSCVSRAVLILSISPMCDRDIKTGQLQRHLHLPCRVPGDVEHRRLLQATHPHRSVVEKINCVPCF